MASLDDLAALVLRRAVHEPRSRSRSASAVVAVVARRRMAARLVRGGAPAPAPRREPLVVLVLAVGLPLGYYLASPIWIRTELVEPDPVAAAPAVAPSRPSPTPIAPAPSVSGGPPPSHPPAASVRPSPVATAVRRAPDRHRHRSAAPTTSISAGARPRSSRRRPARTPSGSTTSPSATARTCTSTCRPAADDYAEGALELGRLKATDGAFGYALPAGTDPADFASAIIWCKQFSHLFAVAPLARHLTLDHGRKSGLGKRKNERVPSRRETPRKRPWPIRSSTHTRTPLTADAR